MRLFFHWFLTAAWVGWAVYLTLIAWGLGSAWHYSGYWPM